jgi:catechol 2,3-dioxygenase-like lactoylglutathione lyase family enzyme
MYLKTDGIDHINLMVKDLEKTTIFWNRLLGFTILEELANENGRIIGNKRAMLAIYENPEMEKVQKNGFSHISFHIENFDDIGRILKKMNLTMKYNKVFYWERSRSVYIEDPNGYEIELAEKWGGGLV